MKRIDFTWPQGRTGALTTSWDDGTEFDRRLVAIFNRYGIKGTFNLNSGKFGITKEQCGWNNYVRAEEIKSLYAGHEVAVHTVTHPWLERQASDMILAEVLEDRGALEALVGYPVRGMALPFGSQDQRVGAILKAAGIVYVRPTARNNDRFALPGDFMDWQVTAHHTNNIQLLWKEFVEYRRNSDKLFYLWGHSYEFDRDSNWEVIEEFSRIAGATPDIWFATNMEVYEYVTAWRNLQCSVDISMIRNTSAVTVWFQYQERLYGVEPGKTVTLPQER